MARKSAASTPSKMKGKAQLKSPAPKSPKSTPGSGSESDEDDVPETLTLDQSKRYAKDERRKMEEWRAEEKERKRERQRQRSKAQGAAEVGDEESRAIARMERAMQDAQDSEDALDEDGLSVGEDDLDVDEEGLGSDDHSLEDEEDLEDDDGQSMDDDDLEDGEWGGVSIDATDEYLPDHLFESAFAAQHAANISAKKQQKKQLLSGSTKSATSSTRKKQTRNSAKDIQLGTNTFRVLPASASPHTIPASLKARKFYEKTLGLKSGGQAVRGRGWERRAANVGVMRRSVYGPASGFARQR